MGYFLTITLANTTSDSGCWLCISEEISTWSSAWSKEPLRLPRMEKKPRKSGTVIVASLPRNVNSRWMSGSNLLGLSFLISNRNRWTRSEQPCRQGCWRGGLGLRRAHSMLSSSSELTPQRNLAREKVANVFKIAGRTQTENDLNSAYSSQESGNRFFELTLSRFIL
jgi:hypothetical protein